MKVFLSWSGARSRQVAEALREWLPCVINALKPWMSASDIDRGARWNQEVAEHLDESAVGIICLTAENLTAPWILFEAGALSKRVAEAKVCTYLFEIRAADVKAPLGQFQASESSKKDTLEVVRTLNKAIKEGNLPEETLNKVYEKWWPDLEEAFKKIKTSPTATKSVTRPDRELLEEILLILRHGEMQTSRASLLRARVEEMYSKSLQRPRAPRVFGPKRVVHFDLSPMLGDENSMVRFVHEFSQDATIYSLAEIAGSQFPELLSQGDYMQDWVYRDRQGAEYSDPNATLKEVKLRSGSRLRAVPLQPASLRLSRVPAPDTA